jgi:hypothetical protein
MELPTNASVSRRKNRGIASICLVFYKFKVVRNYRSALMVLGLVAEFEKDANFDPQADREALIRAYCAHAGVKPDVPTPSADRSAEERLAYSWSTPIA